MKMPPRIFRRDASTATRERPGRLRQPPRARARPQVLSVPPAELERQRLRRILKAERDERMDITMSLTPVKTYVLHRHPELLFMAYRKGNHSYMGGFTRPRDLRATNWFPGGAYILKKKIFEKPSPSAYKPFTVFLLESRYMVKKGLGRVSCHEYMTGSIRAENFEQYLRIVNSGYAPTNLLEEMDNAYWPNIDNKDPTSLRKTKWWSSGQDPKAIRKAALTVEDPEPSELGEVVEGGGKRVEVLEEDLENDLEEGLESTEDDLLKNWDPYDDDFEKDEAVRVKLKTERRKRWLAGEKHLPDIPQTLLGYGEPVYKRNTDPNADQLEAISNRPLLRLWTESLSPDVGSWWPYRFKYTPPAELKYNPLRDPDVVDNELKGTAYHLRKIYIPTLKERPFWRPLLAVTVPSRPVADTILRLGKALPKGLPYYASFAPEDRKSVLSYSGRMRTLRISRMRQLTLETAVRLLGYYGGFIGMRWDHTQRGRGINGELLEDLSPEHFRKLVVFVGDWYEQAGEDKTLFEKGGKEAIVTSLMDDRGRPHDMALSFADESVKMEEAQGEAGDHGSKEEDDDDDD